MAPVEAAQRTQVVPDELTLALSPFNFIVVVRVSYSLDPRADDGCNRRLVALAPGLGQVHDAPFTIDLPFLLLVSLLEDQPSSWLYNLQASQSLISAAWPVPADLLPDVALSDLSQLAKGTSAVSSSEDSDSTLAGTDDADFARGRARWSPATSQPPSKPLIGYILAMSIG